MWPRELDAHVLPIVRGIGQVVAEIPARNERRRAALGDERLAKTEGPLNELNLRSRHARTEHNPDAVPCEEVESSGGSSDQRLTRVLQDAVNV
jgi:hypothetical protein